MLLFNRQLQYFGFALLLLPVEGGGGAGAKEALPAPRIAVLGAGIGGTSAAYFLSKNLPQASIDILEMGSTGKTKRL